MPLRYKTIIGIATIEALMLALLVWNALAFLRNSNETELIKRAKSTTSLFASSIKDAMISNDLATIESLVEEIFENEEIIYITVFGKNNVLFSSRSRLQISRPFKKDFSYSEALRDGVFDTAVDITEGVALFGRLEIGFSIEHIKTIIHEAGKKSLVIAGLELALTALFSFLLGIYLTKSISNLAVGAAEIEKGKLGYQIKYSGKDELSIAVKAFNKMSSRLELLEAEYKKQNENLEKVVKERTSELINTQKELVAKAHKAGMADIASDIIHNIGNTLNSLNVSADLALQSVKNSKCIEALKKTNGFFEKNSENLVDFLTNDDRGKRLPVYYKMLEVGFLQDFETIKKNLDRVKESTKVIAKIVSSQHRLVGLETINEKVHITEIIESMLNRHNTTLNNDKIIIKRVYGDVPSLYMHRYKFIYILSSLIENARKAMDSNSENNRELQIETGCVGPFAYVNVSDNGIGVDASQLTKIFARRYDSKSDRLGLSLHNCANYVSEMGGTIKAESHGKNQGTCISIRMPLSNKS